MTGTDGQGTVTVREVTGSAEKQRIARLVLEGLPEWFEIEQTREAYITDSARCPLFAAFDGDAPVGFLCLHETGRDTVEVHVMGVLKPWHRKGAGRALFEKAREAAARDGYSFIQVKTVQMGRYEDYDRTNRFYLALGFKEFEVFPTLWDEQNPCQIYVMAL